MNNFGYARVSDPAQAVSLGAAKGTMFVAGGTELLNWMRLGIASPANIVDLGGVVSLRGIRKEGGALWIGALTTLSEIEADPTVRTASTTVRTSRTGDSPLIQPCPRVPGRGRAPRCSAHGGRAPDRPSPPGRGGEGRALTPPN